MKKYFLITFIMSISLSLSSQNSSIFGHFLSIVDDPHKSIQVNLGLYSGSNGITNKFLKRYFYNSNLSLEDRKNQLSLLSDNNSMCYILSGDITFEDYQWSYKKLKSWRIGISNLDYNEFSFSKDIFGVYFLGNKPFQDITLKLSGKQNTIKSQTLKIGSGFLFNNFESKFNLGLVIGQHVSNKNLENSSLLSSGIGEQIDLDLKYLALNKNKNHIGSFQSLGASIDLGVKLKLKNKNFIAIEINDFGKIYWNNDISGLEIDTIFSFDGVDVKGFFDSLYLDIGSSEELQESFVRRTKIEKLNSKLPWSLNFTGYFVWLPTKITSHFNARIYPESDFIGNIDLITYYTLKKYFNPGISIGRGFYQEFYAGLGFFGQLGNNYFYNVKLNSLFNTFVNQAKIGPVLELQLARTIN
ncbi:MAG: hypothetical protein IPO62_16500 [Saprospiraceae bacterium]|nr:hypothetical protein [Saprospiraceae bacterium]